MRLRSLWAAMIVAMLIIGLNRAPSIAASFDSAYQFESAFLGNLRPGDTGTFSVFFANTGTMTWIAGTATQVNLLACLDNKITCSVAPEEAAWNPATWLSSTAYATHTKSVVGPGDFSAFTYSIKVPAGTPAGSYRFNGDLGLAASGAKLHPEGYYQDATVAAVAPTGASAPTDLLASVANLNGGTTSNDVHLQFTAPATNTIQTYDVQRALSACPVANDSALFVGVTSLTVSPGANGFYDDLDLGGGTYCYQLRVTDPGNGSTSYSNQSTATIFGSADNLRPTSSSAVLTPSAGFPDQLDTGDVITITFSERMTLAANPLIRLTDADCGTPSSISGPPPCTGGSSQTVADIRCGFNASCILSFDALSLRITMTASPEVLVAGSAVGVQLPAVVTGSTGIADTAGNTWDFAGSPDRMVGPAGQ